MKRLLSIILIMGLTLGLSSCMKDDDNPSPDPNQTVEEMEELSVSDDFDWKTSESVLLKVKGLRNGTVKVKGLNGKTYYKGFHNMFTHVSTMITLPDKIDEVRIEYNEETATVPIVDKKIIHSFIE